MAKEKRVFWTNVYIAALVCVVFVVIPVYYNYFDTVRPIDTRNGEARIFLERELNRIQPIPGAEFTAQENFLRYGKGFVAYSYYYSGHYRDVLRHYDVQLKNNGWQYEKVVPGRYMGTDTGERFVRYKKGEYVIAVKYWVKEENNIALIVYNKNPG